MRAVGVVAEFNPFHHGHAYLLERLRPQADILVAVMSGHLVQRGEPALFDKWTRTRAALLGGADLVLELPAVWSCASAEGFARAGIGLLRAAGCRAFAFGCESGDLGWLREAARRLSLPETDAAIRAGLHEGLSFAAARERAIGMPLRNPNDILAVEYLRAAGNDLEPIPVLRTGAAHDGDPEGRIASASWLRGRILAGEDVSRFLPSPDLYRNAPRCNPAALDRALLYCLRGLTREDWERCPDAGDGLAARLYRAAGTACSVPELCAAAKTRRHALARVRRTVLCAAVGITREDRIPFPPGENCPPGSPENSFCPLPYIRALGMNARGEWFLRETAAQRTLPFGFSLARLAETSEQAARFAAVEQRAWDLFAAGCVEILPRGVDFTAKPIIMKGDGQPPEEKVSADGLPV